MNFYDSFGLFDPVDVLEEEDIDVGAVVFQAEVPIPPEDIEARILAKQKELGIVDENSFDEMDDDNPESPAKTTRFGRSELHEAVLTGDLDFVQKLVENGADLTARDKNGNTPFTLALIEGQRDIAAFLKKKMKI